MLFDAAEQTDSYEPQTFVAWLCEESAHVHTSTINIIKCSNGQ